MKEILFIRNNIEKWRAMEGMIDNVKFEMPDQLADAYTELTADLAFAQTHYPHSRITIYLNKLASALHNEIYRNKREKWSRLVTFWTQEVPDVMWKERKLLLLSFIIFMVSVLIGVVSTLGDESFPRLILGDGYIGITLNNIMVSFNVFVSGVLTSFMSGFLLFRNGIMVGCFDTFFYQHGLLGESLLATMLHGTLELSAIIVAGAAGLAIGNGWLFPGTYSRLVSFQRGAKRGMKIVVGTVPIFIMAGFIEAFITRHTELNNFIRLGIIFVSLAFVVYYFIYLPYKRNYHLENANRKTKD